MRQTLEERFIRFAKGLRGAEFIDDLDLTREQQEAQKADFFFQNRTIIGELKSLKTSTEGKIEAVLEPYRDTPEWPHFYGEQEVHKVTKFLPNGDELNRKIFNAVTDSIEGLIEKANRQIRTTKETFNLPSAGGLLIILNDIVDILTPDVLVQRARRALQKRTQAGERRFPHVTYVWSINAAHYVELRPGLKAMPLLILPSGLPDPNGIEAFLRSLGPKWAAFDGAPFIRGDADTFGKFRFNKFSDDLKRRQPMPRHEVWRLRYRENPYLRPLSKDELFEFGLRALSKSGKIMSVRAKRKPTPQMMDEAGSEFTHFIEEMNFRAIDMREFSDANLPRLDNSFRVRTKEKKTPSKSHKNKIGRGAPCPCQSGKKYNKCCGRGAER
jgi:hypothetical protein